MSAEPVPVPKGVAFNEPPPLILASVNKQIDAALANLKPDQWLTAVVDVRTSEGVNAALVARKGDTWAVSLWIGKKWGAPMAGGASVRVAF